MAFDPVFLTRIQFALVLSFHIAGVGAMIRGIHNGGRPDDNRNPLARPPRRAKRGAQHNIIAADTRIDRNAPAHAGILVDRHRRESARRIGPIPAVIVAIGLATVGNAPLRYGAWTKHGWRTHTLRSPTVRSPGSAGRHLPGRPYRQFQDLAQRGQVFVTRPTVIPLPEIDAGRADANLFCNFCNRQTTLDPSVAEITSKIWLTRQ
ncbi:MAG: hypothetical protein WB902_16580 [Acetobacteraceae bacterium]|jgi:hypothetical protein